MAERLNIPPPTRVAVGYATINTPQGKQRAEVFIDPEWARYFESLNTGFNTISAAVGLPGAAGATGAAGAAGAGVTFGGSEGDSVEFIPGPRGEQGPQGNPGATVFPSSEADASTEFVPGPVGPKGEQGVAGPVVGMLASEYEPTEFVPMVGPQGNPGQQGMIGPALWSLAAENETQPEFTPGPNGDTGATGAAGAVLALMLEADTPTDVLARPASGGLPLTDADIVFGSVNLAITFTTPGNLSVTYASQICVYTKIGRQVTCNFAIVTSAFTFTTASGALNITGWPFTSGAAVGTATGHVSWQGITKASYTQMEPTIAQGTAIAVIRASGSGQAIADIGTGDMPSGGSVRLLGSITYFT